MFRKEFLKNSMDPLIVYAGAFGRINNVIYLVDIAKELNLIGSNVKFLIAGDGFQKIN